MNHKLLSVIIKRAENINLKYKVTDHGNKIGYGIKLNGKEETMNFVKAYQLIVKLEKDDKEDGKKKTKKLSKEPCKISV